MKNITAGIIGAAFGGIVGFCAGAYKSNKTIKQLQNEMNEMEMFYEEQIGKLEERMDEISKKVESKTKYVIDDEEVETADDMDFEDEQYAEAVEKATGNKVIKEQDNYENVVITEEDVVPVNSTDVDDLIDAHKVRIEDVWLFSCGTLTKEDKDVPIRDPYRFISYEILYKLRDLPSDAYDEELREDIFPYFVWNKKRGVVYSISKDDRRYEEYDQLVH